MAALDRQTAGEIASLLERQIRDYGKQIDVRETGQVLEVGLADGVGRPFQWDCAQAVAGFRVFEVTPPRDALPGVTARHFIESLTWHVGHRPEGTGVTELHWTLLEIGANGVGQAGHELLPWSGDWPGLEHSAELAPALSLQMIRTGHVRWRIEGTPPLRGWILRSDKKEGGE